jgi:hypothetical protein
MSKRRKIDDRVWVKPGSSFGACKGEWATIINSPSNEPDELFPCFLYPDYCDDPECLEWNDLHSEERDMPFYHVCECQMFDEPQDQES